VEGRGRDDSVGELQPEFALDERCLIADALYWFSKASAMGSPASVSFGQDRNSMQVMIDT